MVSLSDLSHDLLFSSQTVRNVVPFPMCLSARITCTPGGCLSVCPPESPAHQVGICLSAQLTGRPPSASSTATASSNRRCASPSNPETPRPATPVSASSMSSSARSKYCFRGCGHTSSLSDNVMDRLKSRHPRGQARGSRHKRTSPSQAHISAIAISGIFTWFATTIALFPWKLATSAGTSAAATACTLSVNVA
jgi:hypothetical protein